MHGITGCGWWRGILGDMLRRVWALPVPGSSGRPCRAGYLGVEEGETEAYATHPVEQRRDGPTG